MDLLLGTALGETKEKNDRDSDDEFGYDDNHGASSLPFNLEFFTQCHDLHRLVDYLDSNPMDVAADADLEYGEFDYREDPEYQEARGRTRRSNFHRKYRKLHDELCSVVEDFGLLSFLPLSIQDAESVGRVVARVDKCNGYVFLTRGGDAAGGGRGGDVGDGGMQDLFSSAMVADGEWTAGVLSDVQEKYLGEAVFREDIAELRGGAASERRRIEKERENESIK